MELSKVIESRYSVRRYSSKKVEKEKIEEIIRTSQAAPSAVNYQPVKIIVVESEEGLAKISKATKLYRATLAFIVCADKDLSWKREYDGKDHGDIDASIVTDHMMLKAVDLGLGTVWICRFDPDIIRDEFNIPNNWEIVNILAAGYPDETAAPSKLHTERRSIDEYVWYEKI